MRHNVLRGYVPLGRMQRLRLLRRMPKCMLCREMHLEYVQRLRVLFAEGQMRHNVLRGYVPLGRMQRLRLLRRMPKCMLRGEMHLEYVQRLRYLFWTGTTRDTSAANTTCNACATEGQMRHNVLRGYVPLGRIQRLRLLWRMPECMLRG